MNRPRRTPDRRPGRWRRGAALVLAFAVVVLPASGRRNAVAQTAPDVPVFRLIVHPSNPVTSVDRSFLAQAFLKKIRRWPHGETIKPVDLDPGSRLRERWSSSVLNRSVQAVRSYWQQMIFSGRDLPPPEMGSDDDAVKYVRRTPGGIGYVSSAADLHGVKVITFR